MSPGDAAAVPARRAGGRGAGPYALLALITGAVAASGHGEPTALRHLYVIPALWAALTHGARGGGLVGLVAGLLQAPLALPAIERVGLGLQGIDGVVAMLMPLALGSAMGNLRDQLRARAVRLQAAVDLQRTLCGTATLQDRLSDAAEQVRRALRALRVGLVVAPSGGEAVVASAPPGLGFEPRSAVGWTLHGGHPAWVEDLSRDPRLPATTSSDDPTPTRGLVVPLDSGFGLKGALAVEWTGRLPATTRVAAGELALHLALIVDNARLAIRQMRFAEELEDKVCAATQRLRELDQAKSEFVSVVAHELRTPLTALQGFTELLLSRSVPPERAARFLRHLNEEARRLSRIVTELLDLSRIEAGRALDLRREPVDAGGLGELIERNVDLFVLHHGSHRFLWTVPDDAPVLWADRDALDRILKNLIGNAVKYSPDGGSVRIAAGGAADRPGMFELSVEDDGVGIPAAYLERIFERYVRVSNPATAGVRGLGLGLPLVRALAEAHGGSVEVESLPGKGSTFRVFLPV